MVFLLWNGLILLTLTYQSCSSILVCMKESWKLSLIKITLLYKRSVVHNKGKVKQSLHGSTEHGGLPLHIHFQGSLCSYPWMLISSFGLLVPTGVFFMPKTMLVRCDWASLSLPGCQWILLWVNVTVRIPGENAHICFLLKEWEA